MVEQFNNFKDSLRDKVYDDQFTSILSEKPDKDLAEKWKDFKWTRIPDINLSSKTEPKIFGDIISPNDIKQGCLGDCYFLSSLSVLTKHPDIIRKMFVC